MKRTNRLGASAWVLLMSPAALAQFTNVLDGSSLPGDNGWTVELAPGVIVDLGDGNFGIQQTDDNTSGTSAWGGSHGGNYDEFYLTISDTSNTLATRFRVDAHTAPKFTILALTACCGGTPAIGVGVEDGRFYLLRFIADGLAPRDPAAKLADLGPVVPGEFHEAIIHVDAPNFLLRFWWDGVEQFNGTAPNDFGGGVGYPEFGASNYWGEGLEAIWDQRGAALLLLGQIAKGAEATGVFDVIDLADLVGTPLENRGQFQGADSDFPGDDPNPAADGTQTDMAAVIEGWLELPAGTYSVGVHSDDGFTLTIGQTPVAQFFAGRGPEVTLQTITVAEAGAYPFRLIWHQGGGWAELEFVEADDMPDPALRLVNAPNALVKAFRTSTAGPAAGFLPPISPDPVTPSQGIMNIDPADRSSGALSDPGFEVQVVYGPDPGTSTVTFDWVGYGPGFVTEVCDNQVDDNFNGLIDCEDPACATARVCLCNDPAFDVGGEGLDSTQPDGAVDQTDFGVFQSCFTGSSVAPGVFASLTIQCQCMDVGGPAGTPDEILDQYDFAVFLNCVTGPAPAQPADPACDNP